MTHLTLQVKESFADMRQHPYRLHAAFFHRGSAGGGHYWVYIYDHVRELWRKYNDDRVSVVTNRNEIFGKPTQENWGPPPNPYLLIYIRADKVEELAQTVMRDIVFPPPDQPPPVPARNQMSAMPPMLSGGQGDDVEMREYVNGNRNGGEQPSALLAPKQTPPDQEPYPYDLDISHPQTESDVKKEGNWDDSQLIADRAVNW